MDEPYRVDPVVTLGPNKKHCYACAAILDMRAELCPRCGVRQMEIPMPTALARMGERQVARSRKSKVTAGVFALLLGGLGIHKFYLNQPGQGLLYILFCWTFIPGIIAFVEGILLLTMNDETFAERFG